ncbi:hypothetical protein [Maricaulis salignorans]|uniref:Uncharacterized protein n=1 Tax=Maricaulis salignorans TaxID=144026 RepID=A0A1G9PCL9_9PROT|nr:hypothetical protein [Maricaulis salignorans]SDL96499.1 hypothetical protein SAMN04488568_103187 [Maricaulis salignorans]
MKDDEMTSTRTADATGLIRTDAMAMGVWERLTRNFTTLRLILFAGFSRRSLHHFGNDQLTPLTQASHWKIGLGLLGGLDDAQIDFLKTYAELNAGKVDRTFRAYALLMVTLPVGATIGINEIDPEIWTRLGFSQIDSVIVILGVWAIAVGVLMAAAWRARDLADLLIFEQARRVLVRAHRTSQA